MKKALFLALFSLLFLAQDAHALFDLQVSPRRGGNAIRFEVGGPGGILRNEEVSFGVATDVATQYRIFLTLFEPLTGERGQVIPQDSFVLFSPSNPLGTLRVQQETQIAMGQMPLYTSNAAGDPDEFILVFNVRVPENQPGGVYCTRLQFTAEPVNAGAAPPSIVTLDVIVEITPSFRVDIRSSSGGRSLDLGKLAKDRPVAAAALEADIQSNIGTVYKLTQTLVEPLASPDGPTLDDESLVFTVEGGQNGSPASGSGTQSVGGSPKLLYVSGSQGGSDTLRIRYATAPDAAPQAGVYEGTLRFTVDSNSPSAPPQAIDVPVRLEAQPIFYLDARFDRGTGISFAAAGSSDRQESTASLTVVSNLGQPYQVTQTVSRKLTNDNGVTIPDENFQYFGADAKTGQLADSEPVPVPDGEKVVFTSDAKGTPEKFSLHYLLVQVPKNLSSGSYRSEIVYSITAL